MPQKPCVPNRRENGHMRTCSIYWWIFLILQLLPLHNACGYADSIRLESIAVEVGEGASISIFAALSHQFGGFEIPLASSSVDLVFDSVSLVGTIAEEKLRAGFWLKENPNRIIINLFPHSLFELEPVLPPGGRLCEVYFHIRPDAFSGLVEIDTLSDTINLLPDTLQFRPLRGWDSKGENELPLDFIPGLILVTYPTDALNPPDLGDQGEGQSYLRFRQPDLDERFEVAFALARGGNVMLDLVNILCQRVAVLAHGYFPAGEYHLALTASHYCAGIYFLRLDAGEFYEVRRLLLIK